jgi:hypothetical protein
VRGSPSSLSRYPRPSPHPHVAQTHTSRSSLNSPSPPTRPPPAILQIERVQKKGGLYQNFASEQSLSYLNGTLPGGGCQSREKGARVAPPLETTAPLAVLAVLHVSIFPQRPQCIYTYKLTTNIIVHALHLHPPPNPFPAHSTPSHCRLWL